MTVAVAMSTLGVKLCMQVLCGVGKVCQGAEKQAKN
jgi:hypothetical protein